MCYSNNNKNNKSTESNMVKVRMQTDVIRLLIVLARLVREGVSKKKLK